MRISELAAENAAPKKVLTADEIAQKALASLPERFDASTYTKDLTWYFSLGGKEGPRYTLNVTADGASWKAGRPDGDADCVVKTSVDIFRRIVHEGYAPDPAQFMSGAIKTNDIALLIMFSQVFKLSEVNS